jgi:opacity protein-like surface antigen
MYNMTCHSQADWIDTFTGRTGFVWDRLFSYMKAGAAWTHETFSATCNLGPLNGTFIGQSCANPAGVPSNGFSASDSRVGWTAGLGFEVALAPNWSAKAEYDYVDFRSKNLVGSDGSIIDVGLHISEVKVGLNYHFEK